MLPPRYPLAGALVLLLTGCSGLKGDFPRNAPLVPDASLRLSAGYKIALEDVVQVAAVAAVIYHVADPAAPSWDIRETRLADGRVMYEMRMQAIRQGGEGEARYVLARRADALVRESGAQGYLILRYEEAIDSRIWLPHRTAYAELQLVPSPQPAPEPAPLQAPQPESGLSQ